MSASLPTHSYARGSTAVPLIEQTLGALMAEMAQRTA